ncbi:receptor-like cytosolic serine/threonine-protein kinase RBK2 [Heracleum sosnowskyi]|uniref:non-specific serine/threonine protein kinase n=1 Tax=Heracleum sosnowskyi TaxID=360622 RepID=A0AAD8I7G2_9APIA|nr:receptor-like cytosolic serine/threonine-protein kinase RBK2 [Heracleum sosnowskyi]
MTQSEPESSSKYEFPWRGFGFLRKFRKPPTGPHTSHPAPLSQKKLPKSKSRSSTKSMPAGLPSQLDPDFYCFESSWLNFTLSDLQNATNNFSRENIIGEGGYSEVFRGVLEDGKIVAIKRLTRGTPEEMTSDFLSELGMLVHVNHPNIANVFGYGVEGGMHLVLPLSPHGSLASLLTGEKHKLKWGIRFNIAVGVASGLNYLHEGCQRRIIHRDIKAANILLTEDFQPQISDFGLAKWLPDQWAHVTVSQYEGTFGYLPPEFFLHGLVDEKTDVFAFGVLVLELITGRPAIDKSQKSLVMVARPLIIKKSFEELVDPLLAGVYDAEQMNRMVAVAFMCINEFSTERPQMSQVIRFLKGNEGILGSGRKKFQKRAAFKRTCSVDFSVKTVFSLSLKPHRPRVEKLTLHGTNKPKFLDRLSYSL